MNKSVRHQFAQTMLSIGREDPNLVVMVGDISHFIMQPFAEACPGRYFNIGICEPTMISMAAGMSKMGLFPVAHTIAPFIVERSFEQIKLDFCYQKLAGNLVTVGSAFDYSNLGCTHHCYNDFALLKTLPGAEIVYPSTCMEFDILFRQAYNNDKLTLYRIPGTMNNKYFSRDNVSLGKGIKIAEGDQVTIIVVGPHLDKVMVARDKLLNSAKVEVIYLHTILPLDEEIIRKSVEKTKKVLVVEEHVRNGGLGDDVMRLTYGIRDTKFASLSIPNKFVTKYGTYDDQCSSLGFTAEGIEKKIRQELLI